MLIWCCPLEVFQVFHSVEFNDEQEVKPQQTPTQLILWRVPYLLKARALSLEREAGSNREAPFAYFQIKISVATSCQVQIPTAFISGCGSSGIRGWTWDKTGLTITSHQAVGNVIKGGRRQFERVHIWGLLMLFYLSFFFFILDHPHSFEQYLIVVTLSTTNLLHNFFTTFNPSINQSGNLASSNRQNAIQRSRFCCRCHGHCCRRWRVSSDASGPRLPY